MRKLALPSWLVALGSLALVATSVHALTFRTQLATAATAPRVTAVTSSSGSAVAAPGTVGSQVAPAPPGPVHKPPYPAAQYGFRRNGFSAIRGTTIGPIENRLHPDRGYGSAACKKTMHEVRRMGGNWVSLTPFGRVYDLNPSGISLRFEAPFKENRESVKAAVAQAHAEGLKVLLVPHLWVETGDWRGHIDPGSDAGWKRWAKAYGDFAETWAKVAEESGVDLLAVGVELRRWVTMERAQQFIPVIERVRRAYHGPLTYAANWDDVHDTVIWRNLDVIGINAFYPLAEKEGAPDETLAASARRIAAETSRLAARWGKPIVFTEFGYTTRRDPAVRPWEWPEHLKNVTIDERDQARAYRALLGAFIEEPWFLGMFVWRLYADPSDVSQEPEWGFSPRGKLAEMELVDAFAAHWGADGARPFGTSLERFAVRRVRDF